MVNTPPPDAATLYDAHILVVDDDPKIAQSVIRLLEREGRSYRVSLAAGGQAALDMLAATVDRPADAVDLVLLDITMPRVDGLEVLRWIRRHPDLGTIRVIMLTGVHNRQSIVSALTQGADDYVTKPPYQLELLARIEAILRTQQLEKQLRRQREQLIVLNDIVRQMASRLEAQTLLELTAEGLCRLVGSRRAAIYQVQPGGQALRCQVWYSAESGQHTPPDHAAVSLTGSGILARAYRTRQPVLVPAAAADPDFAPAVDVPDQRPVSGLLAVPFSWQGPDQVLGLVVAYDREHGTFDHTDRELAASLAGALSQSIVNAWLYARLEQRNRELLVGRNTLQAVIDGIPHPIYTIDNQWRLQSVNETRRRDSTIRLNEPCYAVFYGRTAPCGHCRARRTLQTEEPTSWTVTREQTDDLAQEWDVNAYPLPQTDGHTARSVIVWQDRSEERRLEQSLIQAGKLSALGQLAMGLAHEINNPLTAIKGGAEMLQHSVHNDEDREIVGWINAAADRASSVIGGLLDYARQETARMESGDVNQSILQAIRLLTYQMRGTDIEIETALDPDLPWITGDWDQLKSVWVNLLVNARDALRDRPDTRRITVSTRRDPAGSHVQVVVKDNGRGMTDEEQRHIFDPFYTTKDPGAGTGLGLSITNRIIIVHHGDINVTSRPGSGTTFVVRLPIVRPE